MVGTSELVIVDSRYDPSAACLVCGGLIEAGEGLSTRYGRRLLRFRCARCLDKFRANPDGYLAGHSVSCCDEHAESPISEWCD